MSETKISNRYAEALMQQAISDNSLKEVANDMTVLSKTCQSSTDLRNALKNPIIAPQQKLNAMKEIFKGFHKTSMDFITLVCNRNRENILMHFAEAFLDLYRVQQGIVKVDVQTAVALNDKDESSIKKYVQNATGAKTVEIHTEINSNVIGGMIVKFGDMLLDTSISAKLRKLKKELNIA